VWGREVVKLRRENWGLGRMREVAMALRVVVVVVGDMVGRLEAV
jgi:hypothetical protein